MKSKSAIDKPLPRKKKLLRNPIRRTRPERTGIGAPLGDLEITVMRHIWACGPEGCQGTDVQRALNSERPLALTTVLTTLDRLLAKDIVRRSREGKAYRYWAVFSEEQLQQRIVTGVMDRLITQFPQAVAAYFAQQGLAASKNAEDLGDLAKRVESVTREEEEVQEEQENGH